ncbi:hypothetical protein SEA_MEYRAN_56 [Gordonia phage Meyran]|nr:hypothetical protein SEA_MEYRAN_56 [Gordonia phage Meyran]
MSARLIRVSSRATGERREVRVWVYDTLAEMRAAGTRFNGHDFSNAGGITQQYSRVRTDTDGRRIAHASTIIVRICRQRLGTTVVVHEMNHAAVSIYGSSLRGNELAIDVLDNANETLAYLQSDLTGALVRRLHDLGYYESEQR